MDSFDIEERYKEWWEGKYCRLAGRGILEYKYVEEVEFISPPSGFNGIVILHYSDKTFDYVIPIDIKAFKPRKMDVEIEEVTNG